MHLSYMELHTKVFMGCNLVSSMLSHMGKKLIKMVNIHPLDIYKTYILYMFYIYIKLMFYIYLFQNQYFYSCILEQLCMIQRIQSFLLPPFSRL